MGEGNTMTEQYTAQVSSGLDNGLNLSETKVTQTSGIEG
jgi:hypothetical protein